MLTVTGLTLGACGGAHDALPDPEASTSTAETDDDSGQEIPIDTDEPTETGGLGGAANGTGGTGGDTSITPNCARTVDTASDTTTAQPADIIILVDSSPSMLAEIGFVQQNLNEFSEQIIDSGVDVRVIMVAESIPVDVSEDATGICIDPPLGSGSCPDDTFLPRYVHIPQPVGSSNSLDMVMKTRQEWIEYVRPEALRELVVISDADALYPESIIFGEPPLWQDIDFMSNQFFEDFTSVSADLLSPWSFNAVYPFTECAEADSIGEVYAQLVERTHGVSGDLCEQDFQPVFDNLAARVVDDAVTLSCEWALPDPVAGQTFSTELVQVTRTSAGNGEQQLSQVQSLAECAPGSWYFDDPTDPQRILACPETCEGISDDTGGKIDVVFGCEIVEGCSASGAGTLATVSETDDEPVVCQWAVPELEDDENEVDFDSLNVRYVTRNGFGVLLGRVENAEACEQADQAWHYEVEAGTTSIVACEQTCDTLQVADVAQIEALFGCETREAILR
jgi:hypothetical protein